MSEDQKKSSKRIGRPAKNPELGKRINAMFRLNEATRDRLMAAAEAAGRSMSEEIERRIDRSFDDVDLLVSQFGSSETLRLIQAVSLMARVVENRSGKKWTEDVSTKEDFHVAISRFFHLYFYEQGEENSISSLGLSALERIGEGQSAAETVAEVLGLKSKARDEWQAFLQTPEGKAALERIRSEAKAGPNAQKSVIP